MVGKRADNPTLSHFFYLRLMPAVSALLALLVLADYYTARNQILIHIEREVNILAHEEADTLAAFFAHRREDVSTVADAPLLKDYLKNVDYGLLQEAEIYRSELGRYLSQFAERAGIYTRISFSDPSGRELAVGTPSGPITPSNIPVFTSLSKLIPGDIRDTGIISGTASSILYWISIFDDTGRWRGNLVLTCDLDHVLKILDHARIGQEGQAFLIDSSGREIFPAQAPLLKALIADAPIAGTEWKVRLMAKPGEFLRSLRRVQQWMVIVFLIAVFPFLWWISVRIRAAVQPIEEMAEGTRKIAAGDLNFQFTPSPIKELRTLGDSFNEMTRSLKERTNELEARIQELTAIREMESTVIKRLDEETILRTCLRAVAKGLSFDRSGLYWVDTGRKEITGRYLYGAEATGLTEEIFQKRRIPIGGDDILNEVIRSRTTVFAKEPSQIPKVNPVYVQESKTQGFVMAPVCGQDRVFGVLVADNCYGTRPLTESDKEGLTLFANAAGLALENATLFQHLAESEARYRTVLENSPVAILGISGQQWISTWNHGAEQIFGYRSDEVLGKPLRMLFPSDSSEEFTKLLSTVIEHGSVRDYSLPGITKDGRKLDLSLSWGGALPDFWVNKEWTIVIRDATESKKLQQQLIRSEKLSAVGQLISGIAHELNNPLQAVVGYAQLLANGSRETFEEDMRLILESAVRCRKIIDNLLVFVRQGKVEMRSIRLPQIVTASLDLLSYKLKKTQAVNVTIDLLKTLPPVNADPQQIQQVLVNLINNACDAMRPIQGPKELIISAKATNGTVKMEVSDSGPGVPEEIKERIFEPFFSTKPEGSGTGLGLAICKQILTDHNGNLGVYNRPEGGSVFWFELPTSPSQMIAKQKQPQAPPAVKNKSILVLDDESSILGFLKRTLEGDGNRVDTASTYNAAISKASKNPYDLIITDIQLGGSTGLDLYERWSQNSTLPRPEFLFITGDVLNTDIQRTIQQKKLTLIHKPVEIQELKRMAYSLLSDGVERKRTT